MGALGEFSEMEKQIIFNSLQESLSTQYVLASQKAFEAAQTQAFDELEYDECTTGAPSTDIDGNPRPYPSGTNPDMGAYEM